MNPSMRSRRTYEFMDNKPNHPVTTTYRKPPEREPVMTNKRVSIHIHYEDDDGLRLDTRLTTNPDTDRSNNHVCSIETMTTMLEQIGIASATHVVNPELKPFVKKPEDRYNRNVVTPDPAPVALFDWRVRLKKIQGLLNL